jgi:hypothetical protein
MKLMIPTMGVVLELTKPWTFTLHQESRNNEFSKKLGLEWERWPKYGQPPLTHAVTLPAGSKLKVSRIYIRGTAARDRDFDSITFVLNSHTSSKKVLKGRFWAKLKDVNRIHADVDLTSWPGLSDLEILSMIAEEEN